MRRNLVESDRFLTLTDWGALTNCLKDTGFVIANGSKRSDKYRFKTNVSCMYKEEVEASGLVSKFFRFDLDEVFYQLQVATIAPSKMFLLFKARLQSLLISS